MLDAIEGLTSWPQRVWSALKRRPRIRGRGLRSRKTYRVEPLEPRWLLSGTAASPDDFRAPPPSVLPITAVSRPHPPWYGFAVDNGSSSFRNDLLAKNIDFPPGFWGPGQSSPIMTTFPVGGTTSSSSTTGSGPRAYQQAYAIVSITPTTTGTESADTTNSITVGPQSAVSSTDSSQPVPAESTSTTNVDFTGTDNSSTDQTDNSNAVPTPGMVIQTTSAPVVGPQPVLQDSNPWTFRLDWPDSSTAALPLPDVSSLRVHDAFGAGDSSNLYEVHLNPDTHRLEIGIAAANSDDGLPESMQIFDQSGHVYPADQTLQDSDLGPKAYVWNFPNGGDKGTPSALYVKVYIPANLASSSTSFNTATLPYILHIVQAPDVLDGTDGTKGGYSPDAASFGQTYDYTVVRYTNGATAGPGQSTTPIQTPSPPSSSSSGKENTAPESYGTGSGTSAPPLATLSGSGLPSITLVPVANGPLPARSSAPFGGILASSTDPVPPVDPHEAAAGEAEEEEPVPGANDVVVAAPLPVILNGGGGEEDGPVVVARGPGGFPLLATALIAEMPSGDSPEARPNQEGEAAETQLAGDEIPLPATSSDDMSTRTSVADADAEAAEVGDGLASSRRIRRVSALSGVTWAVTLGVGLVLPDLVAAFQSKAWKRPRLRFAIFRPRMPRGITLDDDQLPMG